MHFKYKLSTCISVKRLLTSKLVLLEEQTLPPCAVLSNALPGIIRSLINPISNFIAHLIVSSSYRGDCTYVPLLPTDYDKSCCMLCVYVFKVYI